MYKYTETEKNTLGPLMNDFGYTYENINHTTTGSENIMEIIETDRKKYLKRQIFRLNEIKLKSLISG